MYIRPERVLTPALTQIPFGLLAFLLLDAVCVFLRRKEETCRQRQQTSFFVLPSAHSIVTEYLIE